MEQGESPGDARSGRGQRARPRAARAERLGRGAQAAWRAASQARPGDPGGRGGRRAALGRRRRASWAARPGSRRVAQTYSTPLASGRRSAAAGSAPTLAQKPSSALLGAPSAPNAACQQGVYGLKLHPDDPHRACVRTPCLIVDQENAGEHVPRAGYSCEYRRDGTGLGGRPAHGLRAVLLARGDAGPRHGQPPRRAVHVHRAVRQPQPRQQRRHALPAARPCRLGARMHGNMLTVRSQP